MNSRTGRLKLCVSDNSFATIRKDMLKMVGNFGIIILVFLTYFNWTEAQLPTTESLRNETACDLNTPMNLACNTGELIAIHSVQFAYDSRCDSSCCSYASTDCFEYGDASDIYDIQRKCSGQTTCNITNIKSQTLFCAYGVQFVSYVFIQFYCIPTARISSICSSGVTLTSNGEPLYITNEGYPSVTIGSTSCSCSFEAYSCESEIDVFIVDADLYLDTSTCEQNLVFKNSSGSTLEKVDCGNYYTINISSSTIGYHYSRIDFINNSTQNQEGYFFIGLAVSQPGTPSSLSCNSVPETWCVDCDPLPTISNGNILLDDTNNAGYQAIAIVNCTAGYETNMTEISCLANATWESPNDCTRKGIDCGPLSSISYGSLVLDDASNTTYQATATVNCDTGFDPSVHQITCLISGNWESAQCQPKDCGTVSTINHGNIVLNDNGNSTFGATAEVICDPGYQNIKTKITCISTGMWESVQNCTDIDTEEDGKGDTGLEAWIIPFLIVIGIIAIAIVIVCIVCVIKHSMSRDVAPESSEKKSPPETV